MEFFRRLAELLETETVILATVIQTRGSTPREIGAKMIIRENGQIFGTIGGGAGEAKIIAAAPQVFESGVKQFVEIDLTSGNREGICGGKMRILLEQWRGEKSLELVKRILQNLENGQSVKLSTPLTSQRAPYFLSDDEASDENAFVENLKPVPILLIVGAGHVGIELAKIAFQIGFEIVVQDDRPEWANGRNYPNARQISNLPIEETIPALIDYTQLYIVLLTRGFRYDCEALETIFKSKIGFCYLGMIGSGKRIREVFNIVQNAGVEKKKLAEIHAPVGLDIGALTPAEIAVSIAAELISVRRKQNKTVTDCK